MIDAMSRYRVTVTNGYDVDDKMVVTCDGNSTTRAAEFGLRWWLLEGRPRVPLSIEVDEVREGESAS